MFQVFLSLLFTWKKFLIKKFLLLTIITKLIKYWHAVKSWKIVCIIQLVTFIKEKYFKIIIFNFVVFFFLTLYYFVSVFREINLRIYTICLGQLQLTNAIYMWYCASNSAICLAEVDDTLLALEEERKREKHNINPLMTHGGQFADAAKMQLIASLFGGGKKGH